MMTKNNTDRITDNIDLRAVVLDLLLENERDPGYSHAVIRRMLDKYGYLSKTQRAFLKKLSEGTIERRIEEDWLIDSFSNIRSEKMKPVIRNILRMSVYQMRYMDSIPKSAVCNEAVKLSVKRGFASLKGFVNGVLRNIARNIGDVKYPDRDSDFVGYCSIRYSMPEFLVRHFINECGHDSAEKIFQGFEEDRKLYILCNTRLIGADELRLRLIDEGVAVKDTAVPYAFEISGYDSLTGLASFNEGLFQVQDMSSIFAGLAVNPKPQAHIIDVCASPGGKSLHAVQRAEDVTVEARDISLEKTAVIESNIERMRAGSVSVKVWDASFADPSAKETADIVICDVPCTGMGILGRKADIRYNITQERADSLVELQRRILSASSGYVKPGGYLIYSTCTVNKAENLDNVLWFTKEFPYELDSIEEDYPMLDKDSLSKGYVQLLPGIDGTDGFFIARLKRRES